jgi:hypothetical protein
MVRSLSAAVVWYHTASPPFRIDAGEKDVADPPSAGYLLDVPSGKVAFDRIGAYASIRGSKWQSF